MSRQFLIRRILIAIPSLLGISVVLFTVLALAPGDPFGELVTNPNVPASVRLALRAQFGLDDPVYIRYLRNKIDKGFEVPLIMTRWGEGYLLRGEESA